VDGRPRRISETPAPISAYGRSKLDGEAEARAAEGQGVEVVVLRVPAVYGPGDRASFLPLFKLVKRRLAPLPSGAARRAQLVYVADLVRAFARAADASPAPSRWPRPAPTPSVSCWTHRRRGGDEARPHPHPPALFRAAGTVAGRWGGVLGGAGVFNREKAEEVLAEAWECDLSGSEALLPPTKRCRWAVARPRRPGGTELRDGFDVFCDATTAKRTADLFDKCTRYTAAAR
jgi:hypothetical protein